MNFSNKLIINIDDILDQIITDNNLIINDNKIDNIDLHILPKNITIINLENNILQNIIFD